MHGKNRMSPLGKRLAYVLVFIIAFGLVLVEPCMAPVTVPVKPNGGPEVVSVVVHNNPVWRPPVIHTNPYTGEILSTDQGMSLSNGTVEVTIRNRPFTPYTDENGNTINTYYCIFYRLLTGYDYGWLGWHYVSPTTSGQLPITIYQSDSDYTTISFKYGSSLASPDNYGSFGKDPFLMFGDVSFRIQAVEGGYFTYTGNYGTSVYEGVGSEWSEFTISMPSHDPYREKNPSGTFKPNIKPTSIAPETSNPNNLPTSEPARPPKLWTTYLLIIIITTVCFTPLVIVAYRYRQRKNKHYIQTIPPNPQTRGL